MDVNIQELINKYQDILGSEHVNNIKKLQFGFIVNINNTIILNVLIHCLEHLGIFSETQQTNIINLLNKFDNA